MNSESNEKSNELVNNVFYCSVLLEMLKTIGSNEPSKSGAGYVFVECVPLQYTKIVRSLTEGPKFDGRSIRSTFYNEFKMPTMRLLKSRHSIARQRPSARRSTATAGQIGNVVNVVLTD